MIQSWYHQEWHHQKMPQPNPPHTNTPQPHCLSFIFYHYIDHLEEWFVPGHYGPLYAHARSQGIKLENWDEGDTMEHMQQRRSTFYDSLSFHDCCDSSLNMSYRYRRQMDSTLLHDDGYDGLISITALSEKKLYMCINVIVELLQQWFSGVFCQGDGDYHLIRFFWQRPQHEHMI